MPQCLLRLAALLLILTVPERILKRTFTPGPADPSIYAEVNANCIATDMEAHGVRWIRPDAKGTSSRKNGWEIMRRMLHNSVYREGPGLFVFDTCTQFIRTVPGVPRDETDMDDVDTDTEDHIADESRYRALTNPVVVGVAYVPGMF